MTVFFYQASDKTRVKTSDVDMRILDHCYCITLHVIEIISLHGNYCLILGTSLFKFAMSMACLSRESNERIRFQYWTRMGDMNKYDGQVYHRSEESQPQANPR